MGKKRKARNIRQRSCRSCSIRHNTVPLQDVKGIVGNQEYTLYGLDILPKLCTNTADACGRPPKLYDGRFYVVDMGEMEKEYNIVTASADDKVKMFVVYK